MNTSHTKATLTTNGISKNAVPNLRSSDRIIAYGFEGRERRKAGRRVRSRRRIRLQ